jgi:hypothetical protein
MATCEKCNATFTPATGATEVTSTRILCNKCEAERRAERLKRAASAAPGSAGGASAASSSSASNRDAAARDGAPRADVPPVPAAQKRAVASGASAARAAAAPITNEASSAPRARPASTNSKPTASRPAASASETTPSASEARIPSRASETSGASASESSARLAKSGPSARSSEGARSAASARPSASRASAAPVAEPRHKPIPGAKGLEAPLHPDVRREAEMLRRRQAKTMTYAWIACGVLALIAGGVWFKIHLQKQHEIAVAEAQQKRVDDFLAKMKGFKLDDKAQAEEAIKTADADKFWKDTDIAGQVGAIVTTSMTNLEYLKDKQEIADRLTNAEIIAKDFATKSADELAKVRRTLDDLESKGDMMGDEFKKRVTTAKTTIERAYMTRLHDEAKTQAAAGPANARVALTSYTKAEEEALKQFEKNIRTKSKEGEDYFKAHYLDIVKESDALGTALFTPDEIGKAQWTDLLAPAQKDHWQHYEFKGWRLENGALEAVGADPGAGKDALMAVPEAGGYRDFQLECTFTLNKGNAKFCFRLGKRVDRQTAQYDVNVGPKSTTFKAGQEYTALVTFVGSKFTIVFTPPDVQPYEEEVRWDVSRKGALGIVLSEGAELKLSKFRLRELR